MCGTSHKFEQKVFEGLNGKFLPPLRDLLNNYTLSDMVRGLDNGPTLVLKKQYPSLSQSEWEVLYKKVCFSKITYIDVNKRFRAKYLIYLYNLIARCLDIREVFTEQNATSLKDFISPEYFHTQEWLSKNAIVLRSSNNGESVQLLGGL